MSDLEKIAVAIIGVALVTTLILPGRNTAQVLQAGGNAFSGVLGTAIQGNSNAAGSTTIKGK